MIVQSLLNERREKPRCEATLPRFTRQTQNQAPAYATMIAEDIVVCSATALEASGIPNKIAGRSITILRTGIGAVNAAFSLTRLLERSRPNAVLVCGVGGAYPDSGLEPKDVVCASSEIYADLGAQCPSGFLDMHALGFPVINADPPLFNQLPLDLLPLARRVPFATCTTCTGSDVTAAAIRRRTGAYVESMEGAAFVHVARLSNVPIGEIRGISNVVGERARRSWQLSEAAALAVNATVASIESGLC